MNRYIMYEGGGPLNYEALLNHSNLNGNYTYSKFAYL